MKSTDIIHWFVFYTKPRFEKRVHEKLLMKGLQSFLPTVKMRRKWSDRYKIIEEPLFPSYIFAHVNEKGRLEVLKTDGIVRCISFNGKFATISDGEIGYLKRIVQHKQNNIQVSKGLVRGARVKVLTGSLKGMEGVIEYVQDERWVVFNVDIINHSIKIKLSVDEVIKIMDPESTKDELRSNYSYFNIKV